MIDAMINQAQTGNVQAITFLRDTIGEKPTDKVEADLNLSYEAALKRVSEEDEY